MKKRKWLKVTLMTFAFIITILLLAIFIVIMSFDSIIKTSLQSIGSKMTGSEVTLAKASIHFFAGEMSLDRLRIANPPGEYSKTVAFSIDKIYTDVDVDSLFTDKIIIDEIKIDAPAIYIEPSAKYGTNLNHIQRNIENYVKKHSPKKTKTVEQQKDKPAENNIAKQNKKKPKLIIKKLILTNIKIAAVNPVDETEVNLSVKEFIMRDIGDNRTLDETIQQMYYALNKLILNATARKGLTGFKELENESKEVIKEQKNLIERTLDDITDLF